MTGDGTGYNTHTYQWDAEGRLASVDWSPNTPCGTGSIPRSGTTACYWTSLSACSTSALKPRLDLP